MMKTKTNTYQMIKRPADSRGQANHGWLQARFTFSFAEYVDPDHMGFHALRVMNNDTIAPAGGFPLHPHDNMEIFTYVVSGQLAHEDSLGNGAVIETGEMQYMSAGRGIRHSEFNPSSTEATTLYQVWLTPNERDGEPRYAEKSLNATLKENELTLLFSSDGRGDSTAIRQDADIYFGRYPDRISSILPESDRYTAAWIQVIGGGLRVGDDEFIPGDGLALEGLTTDLRLDLDPKSEIMIFRFL